MTVYEITQKIIKQMTKEASKMNIKPTMTKEQIQKTIESWIQQSEDDALGALYYLICDEMEKRDLFEPEPTQKK